MNLTPLSFDLLLRAVEGNAIALRCRVRLQPAGGAGDKVFPPTYNGGMYAVETRRMEGEDLSCVLLDSVQSQANRMEAALEDACEDGLIDIPRVAADLSKVHGYERHGKVTTLTAPHRLADAILRDTEDDRGLPFRKTEMGLALSQSHSRDATAMFKWCPHALIFGQWDSTGPKGGPNFKFPRVLVSEIIAVNAQIGRRTSSRLDPLGIPNLGKDEVIYEAEDVDEMWTLDRARAKKEKPKVEKAKEGKAAKAADDPKLQKFREGKVTSINHGNVTPDVGRVLDAAHPQLKKGDELPGGVTMDYALSTTVLTVAGLRRLVFPTGTSAANPAHNVAARTVLAALGLLAATLLRRDGFQLRSRALLQPEAPATWEILHGDGTTSGPFSLDEVGAKGIFDSALARASAAGLQWAAGLHLLRPKANLLQLLEKAAERMAAGAAVDDGSAGVEG